MARQFKHESSKHVPRLLQMAPLVGFTGHSALQLGGEYPAVHVPQSKPSKWPSEPVWVQRQTPVACSQLPWPLQKRPFAPVAHLREQSAPQ